MGVRGLTTFIGQNSNKYLRKYELHDTYLVVDGNNLAAQLYKWHAKCYDCFGGDYDKYAQTVVYFFNLLSECNVIPLILYDGGYEDKKLKTVYSRVKTRIKQTKLLNCATENSMTVFPLFLRDLFVEITLKLSLKVVRCMVEADYEMACIARKLNCPLLSYDSDFYIFDVEYIPFNTLTLNTIKGSSKTNYKYIDCKVYNVDNFLKVYGGLKKECVPLLGVLLGNDYIHMNIFHNFFKQLKKSKNKSGDSDQQRRIKSLITWLQNETFESALRKVLGRIRQVHRHFIAQKILSVANNYICSESELLKYLNLNIPLNNQNSTKININVDDIYDTESDTSSVNEESQNEETESSDDDNLLRNIDECTVEISTLSENFKDKYRRCLYPTCFIDIVLHNRYIFIPVIENYFEPQCHNISLCILSAIYKILNLSATGNLKCMLRNERGRLQSYKIPKSMKVVPSLNKLEELTLLESVKYMLDVLEINKDILNVLNEFPPSWRLYMLSIIYWIQNAKPNVNECYICSLLICALLIKNTDIGYYRSENLFLKRYQKNIRDIQSNPQKKIKDMTMNVKCSLDAITQSDGIMIMKEIISNFDMVIKMKRNPKLFDHNIIHMFAQFQSSALHIKYLNSLLNKPFEDYLISDFYNGTLIYNLSTNFLSRPQLDLYLRLLMKNAPNFYNAFIVIKTNMLTYLSNFCIKHVISKRRRKKKKKIYIPHVDNEILSSDDNVDDVYDVNNKFSLLKIIGSTNV